jgi:hypothetical protein
MPFAMFSLDARQTGRPVRTLEGSQRQAPPLLDPCHNADTLEKFAHAYIALHKWTSERRTTLERRNLLADSSPGIRRNNHRRPGLTVDDLSFNGAFNFLIVAGKQVRRLQFT